MKKKIQGCPAYRIDACCTRDDSMRFIYGGSTGRRRQRAEGV